jgi:hypothetical protein
MSRHAQMQKTYAALADLQGLLEQAAKVEVHSFEKAERAAVLAQEDAEQDCQIALRDWNNAVNVGSDPRFWSQWAQVVSENQDYLGSATRAYLSAQTALSDSRFQLAGLTAQSRSLHKYQALARAQVVRRLHETRLEAWQVQSRALAWAMKDDDDAH